MVSSLTPIFSKMFVGELDRLSFFTDAPVEFAISTGGKVVFKNDYVPDEQNTVTLYGIGEILETYISDLCADFSFTVNGQPLGAATITVFRCSYNIDVRASDFLQSFFLTPMQGERITAIERNETLSLYSYAEEAATADCSYFFDGEIKTATVALGSGAGSRLLNVSPRRFIHATWGKPVTYTVRCGSRMARYNVLQHSPEISAAFIFRNAFNAWETLYLIGTRETEPQYTRSAANVNGFIRNYNIDEVLQMKTFTGPLPDGMEEVAMNLGRSKAVFFLLSNGDAGEEVLINDCDLKHNNEGFAASDLNFSYRSATVSYRLADDRSARMHVPRPPKIFDATFDQTYE